MTANSTDLEKKCGKKCSTGQIFIKSIFKQRLKMTRNGETEPLLRARSAQGQNNDAETGNIEENQGNQQSQEVRIRF